MSKGSSYNTASTHTLSIKYSMHAGFQNTERWLNPLQ